MTVLIDETTDAVRTLRMNRPQSRNALSGPLVEQLTLAFRSLSDDPKVRAVVLAGEGGAFCSGADLKLTFGGGPEAIQGGPPEKIDRVHALIRAVHACPKPIVALVDGPAVGFGCDLALACDLRIATERGYFQEKFVAIGLVPDGGGTWFLPRLVGAARAAELAMLGDKVDAAEALRLGLVSRVVAVDEGMPAARALAERLAKGPPRALARIKRLIATSGERSLDAALDAEKAAQLECLEGPEVLEGVSAFLEKRAAKF